MTAALLALASVAFAVAGAGLLAPPLRVGARRRGRLGAPGGAHGRSARLVTAFATVGARLRLSARARAPRDLEIKIAAAALAGPGGDPLGVREVMAAKVAAALAGALLGAVLGPLAPGRLGLALAVAAPVGGFLAPDLLLARRAQARARDARRELPALLDLLRVAIEAGLPLAAALAQVGERTVGPLGREWRTVGRELALGVPLETALADVSRRLALPELQALVGALERAARHGAPLAETLEAQARDARLARRRRIQEDAAKAGPKIQLVVALLLVPSVLLIVAAALAAAMLEGGSGLGLT